MIQNRGGKMDIQALLIWHSYKDGKIVNYL